MQECAGGMGGGVMASMAMAIAVLFFLLPRRGGEGGYGQAFIIPEGPYALLLWNQVPKDHPYYGFGDLIP